MLAACYMTDSCSGPCWQTLLLATEEKLALLPLLLAAWLSFSSAAFSSGHAISCNGLDIINWLRGCFSVSWALFFSNRWWYSLRMWLHIISPKIRSTRYYQPIKSFWNNHWILNYEPNCIAGRTSGFHQKYWPNLPCLNFNLINCLSMTRSN